MAGDGELTCQNKHDIQNKSMLLMPKNIKEQIRRWKIAVSPSVEHLSCVFLW
jgi:hypothetical protein